MNSPAATVVSPGGTVKKKKSLKQLFIPIRSRREPPLPKHSLPSPQTTIESPTLTAVPVSYASRKSPTGYSADPLSSPSSRTPSSAVSEDLLLRPESTPGSSRQADKIITPGAEQADTSLPLKEPVKQGRGRASTLTNFSKPYGALHEQILIPPPRPLWQTPHPAPNTLPEGNARLPDVSSTDDLFSPRLKRRAVQHRNFTDLMALSDNPDDIASQQSFTSMTTDNLDSPDATQSTRLLSHGHSHSMQSLQSSGSSMEDSKHSSVFTKFSSSIGTVTDTDIVDEIHEKNELSINDVIDFYADLDEDESVALLSTTVADGDVDNTAEIPAATIGTPCTAILDKVFPPAAVSNVVQWPLTLHRPPALRPATTTHDQYGFRKASRDITEDNYNKWYKDYSISQARRLDKWHSFLTENGYSTVKPIFFPHASSKMQRYIRKGIPAIWRGDAWFYYAGGFELLSKLPGHYVNLVAKSQTEALSRNDKEAVERDLHRTFPDNLHYKSETNSTSNQIIETPIMSALRRVLCAFAVDHPRIGYCQSLNFIAGLLLLFLPEEKTYWMLHIIATRLLPGTHETSLEGANIDMWVLMLALKQANPGVWTKIGANAEPASSYLPPTSLCTTAWFMSVFIGTLPIECVLRVWDVLFYEGSKTLFRIALGIFKEGESQIKSNSDPLEIFQIVQTLPRTMVDIDKLFDVAFSRGEVGRRWIEKKRKERKAFYAKERSRERAMKESREAGTRKITTSHGESVTSPTTSTFASHSTNDESDGNWDHSPGLGRPVT